MSTATFNFAPRKATRKQAKLRMALEGPAGHGKTLTALKIARGLVGQKGRIYYLDTEAGSSEKYAPKDGQKPDNDFYFDFDAITPGPPFHPDIVVGAIAYAVENGYDAVVLDSLSHYWAGDGGMLDIVDQIARTKYRGDSHRAWKDGGEIQQRLIDAVLRSPIHIIACMRTKTDTVREEVQDENGRTKTKIRKAGTKTVQRDEFDYEFDLVGRFDAPAILAITKSRCPALPPEETVIEKPGDQLVSVLAEWLGEGAPVTMASDDQLKAIDTLCTSLADARGKQADDVRKALAQELGVVSLAALTDEQAAQALGLLAEWKQKIAAKAVPLAQQDSTNGNPSPAQVDALLGPEAMELIKS